MQLLLTYMFVVLVVFGGLHDVARFKLPNYISYGIIVVFAIFAALNWRQIPVFSHLGVGLVLFVICFAFWQLKWMGGGDVKFLTAIGLWMGPQNAIVFSILLSFAAAGFLILLKFIRFWNPWFQGQALVPQFFKTLLEKSDRTIPYGLPAAIATVVTLFLDPAPSIN